MQFKVWRPYLDSSLLFGNILWDNGMIVANGPTCIADYAVGMRYHLKCSTMKSKLCPVGL